MEKYIYLDNNATTKVDQNVIKKMIPYFTDIYANASSRHEFGFEAKKGVKKARQQVADLINCEADEIIFTSGSTESINLAIKGLQNKEKNHIVTVKTEHSAVLDTCKYLEKNGCEITYLFVNREGLIDLNELKNSIKNNTSLVSVMFANNETGVIQPIKEIAEIVHEKEALFMTDATQVVGKIPIDVNKLGIDLMTISAHKFYGPKGIGALYVRSRRPRKVKLEPIIHGGGHERSFRSGTSNVSGIVGLGVACEIASKNIKKDSLIIKDLRDYLENELLKIEDTFINGHKEKRLYNTSNICFKGFNSEAIIMGLKNIIVSNGSACTSTSIYPSHVLMAMGLSEKEAFSSIRFSLGKFNTKNEIEFTIEKIKDIILNLRVL
ncbi:MAG: cysteine desulfurase family protein [Candidatus Sericytochromatia bacterium]